MGFILLAGSLSNPATLLAASISCRVISAPPAIEGSHSFYKLMSKIQLKVDRIVNAVPIID
jgi:hypothetical protein